MATLMHAESRRLYSWWWDSHISPKNSKWLQENLKDMDSTVKAMIKLLEEDADSFARRAEMYYKKRPELMKLVEEFYRAYRALAERYDHATGALRQAHRTMAEAFPNQVPFMLSDELPPGPSATEAPHDATQVPPIHATFDSDNSRKDAFSMSSQYHDIKRNSVSEESDALTGKKGLKQLNEMFGSGEEESHAKSAEGRVRKGLNFHDEDGNSSECKLLQEEVSQLSKEIENLKSRITSEIVRADKAEAEVQRLKENISKLSSEKEAALLQRQLSLERISKLETEISRSKEDLNKLNDEMLMVVVKLNSAEERCHLLEKVNESLQLELGMLKQRAKEQQEELSKKQEELEKLNILLQDEQLRFIQAETARRSVEKLHSQSQEEIGLLALEIQTGIEKLKGMEVRRMALEEELCELKEENGNLNEQHRTSALEIINLQDEIVFLKDSKVKLEDDVRIHAVEKNLLHQEMCSLKEDRNDLMQSYHRLTEQVEAVNSNAESLQAMVEELQNRNTELKERCQKLENEKVSHVESLKHMEKMSEKNVVLENSLSDAHVEIESFREKIKTIEESCESLSGNIAIHQSEKAMLVSQVEAISQNMEKLSERNIFLENSLSDVNIELEGLRGKLKVLEESCQSLSAQKSMLLSEKNTLISQVEGTIQSLENLEDRYAELEGKHLDLEREKDLTFHQFKELQDSFKREKEEYETLIMSIILSSKSQVSTLENQFCLLQEECQLRNEKFEMEHFKVMDAQMENFILRRCLHDMSEKNLLLLAESQKLTEASNTLENQFCLLQEECQLRKEEFEMEHFKVMDAQMENFILRRCLHDMSEKNLLLSAESQNLAEASKCAGKLISELKQELLVLEKNLTKSEEHNEKLREGIQLMLRELHIGQDCGTLYAVKDELILQLTLHEIRDLMNSFSVVQDENQHLLLEKSVVFTILEQFGLNVMDLAMGKNALEQESKTKTEALLVLRKKELELLEMNEQLMQDVQASNQSREVLKAEIDVLCRQLIDLRVVCSRLEIDNQSLSKELDNLKDKKDTLEEENSVMLLEAMALDNLCLIIRSSSAEKTVELQLISNDLACLYGVTNDLDNEIRLLAEKLASVEVENVCLKETVVDLYEWRNYLTILEDNLNTIRNVCKILHLEVESGKNLLVQKGLELLEANQKLLSSHDKNTELCRNLEGLQMNIDGAMVVREELESKIFGLSEDNVQRENEIRGLRQANEMLNWEINKLHKEVDDLRNREVHLASELEKGVDELNSCEVDITTLFQDVQITTINATLLEEKVLELLITCESLEISTMIQRDILLEEITKRNANVDELKEKTDTMEGENRGLKELLNAYLFLVTALWDDITALEEDILSLAKHYASSHQEKQGNQLLSHHHNISRQEPKAYHSAITPVGILELQTLHAKVKALNKVVIDTRSLIEQEMFESNASLEAAIKEIEVLKSKGNSGQEEQIVKVVMEKKEEPITDCKLQKVNAENSLVKDEQIMKDIQLDLVFSPQYSSDMGSCGLTKIENAGNNEQLLDLSETTERDCINQMQKVPPVTSVLDIEYHPVETMEEKKNQCPSELVLEKELTIDKLELPQKAAESHQEWNRRVIERLASDAQRLSVLETSAQELKRNMETSEIRNYPSRFEFDTVRLQLKEAEVSILQLIDINVDLTKKAEDFSASLDSLVPEQNEMHSKRRRQISERAQRGSATIGRLELELQKIQYILLKLKEEHENKRARDTEKRRVLLRDYLYGKMDRRKQKRGLCGCVRPKTLDD